MELRDETPGMLRMTRRDCLKRSVMVSLALLPCGRFVSDAVAVSEAGSSDYFLARKQELTGTFQEVLKGARQFWAPEFGAERSQQMAEQALALFEKLLPEFPDVGGEKNWDSQYIPIAAWYVALYGVMKPAGKTAEDVGKLVYELNKIGFREVTPQKAAEEQEKTFSRESLDKMRVWSEWTRKREYPANWVAEFVPSDGQEFDFGYDYSECALVKYFKARGVPELAPYVCLNDFLKSALFGTGLQRTKTLAQGDGCCNFRYKKGRPVRQDWSTEIALIRTRSIR